MLNYSTLPVPLWNDVWKLLVLWNTIFIYNVILVEDEGKEVKFWFLVHQLQKLLQNSKQWLGTAVKWMIVTMLIWWPRHSFPVGKDYFWTQILIYFKSINLNFSSNLRIYLSREAAASSSKSSAPPFFLPTLLLLLPRAATARPTPVERGTRVWTQILL